MPTEFLAPIAVAALVVALLSLLLSLVLAIRIRRLGRRGRVPESGNAELDQALVEMANRLEATSAELAEQSARLHVSEDQGRRAVQNVGVVRYNPFEDTGSNQSFALALLDSEANGLVISSLHSRQMTRVYLKQVVAGRSETALSDEEAEALRRAGSTAHDRS